MRAGDAAATCRNDDALADRASATGSRTAVAVARCFSLTSRGAVPCQATVPARPEGASLRDPVPAGGVVSVSDDEDSTPRASIGIAAPAVSATSIAKATIQPGDEWRRRWGVRDVIVHHRTGAGWADRTRGPGRDLEVTTRRSGFGACIAEGYPTRSGTARCPRALSPARISGEYHASSTEGSCCRRSGLRATNASKLSPGGASRRRSKITRP